MARARKGQRAADFHEWRKQIKALWYELRLVEGPSARAFDETSKRFVAPKPGSATSTMWSCSATNSQRMGLRATLESILTVSGWSGTAINVN